MPSDLLSSDYRAYQPEIGRGLALLMEEMRSCQLFGCKLSPGPMALYAVANS